MKTYSVSKPVAALFQAGLFTMAALFGRPVHADVTISPGASIQAALDAVGNAGGGTVFMNSGNYSVWTPQNIPNNVTLKGVTTRPVITLTNGANVRVVTNKSVPFSNCKVDFISVNGGLTTAQMLGNSYNSTNGIDLSDHFNLVWNTNGTIINCYATNCSMGYNMGRIHTASRLDTCWVTNCGGGEKGTTPGLHNIYISTCDPFIATHVTSTNCLTGMGLKDTDFDGTNNEQNNTIQYCTCTGNQGIAGKVNGLGIGVFNIPDAIIQNNRCQNNIGDGILVWNLIGGSGSGQLLNNVTTGNTYQLNVSYDIYLIGLTGWTISGNTYGTKNGF